MRLEYRGSGRGRGLWAIALGFSTLAGCQSTRRAEPVVVPNPTLGAMTIAVAPAINLSGGADFDPNRFADLMASELSFAEEISVIPVSRVLALLAMQGSDRVESPSHAFELAAAVGADGVLVFAVTEYDPYDPPSVGISAQLYGLRPRTGERALDPSALSRQGSLVASRSRSGPPGLLAQTQRVFDASHAATVADLRAFAARRDAEGNPYGWRKYVVSQQAFMRYCCHRTIGALLKGEEASVEADVDPKRVRTP